MAKQFQYFSLDICETYKKFLYPLIEEYISSRDFKIYSDHVTLMHRLNLEGNEILFDKLDYMRFKECIVCFKLTHIGVSDACIAFRVEADFFNEYCLNKIPHLTYLTYKGHSPYESNLIENWIPISPIMISGKVSRHDY